MLGPILLVIFFLGIAILCATAVAQYCTTGKGAKSTLPPEKETIAKRNLTIAFGVGGSLSLLAILVVIGVVTVNSFRTKQMAFFKE